MEQHGKLFAAPASRLVAELGKMFAWSNEQPSIGHVETHCKGLTNASVEFAQPSKQ